MHLLASFPVLHLRQTGYAWSHETLRCLHGSQAWNRPFLRRPGVPNSKDGDVAADGSILINAWMKLYDIEAELKTCCRYCRNR